MATLKHCETRIVRKYWYALVGFYPYAWCFGVDVAFCLFHKAPAASLMLAFGPLYFRAGVHTAP